MGYALLSIGIMFGFMFEFSSDEPLRLRFVSAALMVLCLVLYLLWLVFRPQSR